MMILFFVRRSDGVGTAQQSAAWSKKRLSSGKRHHSRPLHGVEIVQQFTAKSKKRLREWEGETAQQSSARCKTVQQFAAWNKERLQGRQHSTLLHTNV